MIRVVLDTNVIVSAALTPSGPSFRIIELAGRNLIQLWTSLEIFAEYKDVLSRPRIDVSPTQAKLQLAALKRISKFVAPTKVVRVSPDPDDNMFLECAETAKAHYLITGNVRDFPMRWKYTTVVTHRQFLDFFASSRPRRSPSDSGSYAQAVAGGAEGDRRSPVGLPKVTAS